MGQQTTPATATTTPEGKKPKKEKVVLPSVFETAEAAQKEAAGREKGAKRAFTCTHGGKTFHVVAHNEGRAGGVCFGIIGGTVSEIGRTKKQKAPQGVAGILEACGQLPETERAAVLAQLKALLGEKAGPTKK